MSKYWLSPGLCPLQEASSVPDKVPAPRSSRSAERGCGPPDTQRRATIAPAGRTTQCETSAKWKTRGSEIKHTPSSSWFQLSAGASGAALFRHPVGSSSLCPLWLQIPSRKQKDELSGGKPKKCTNASLLPAVCTFN